MYKLYFVPSACSLATQVVLNELKQPVEIINKADVTNFHDINPVGTVPVLVNEDQVYAEGAAVMLHLLERHPNNLFPADGQARQTAIQNIMFANATMHPAYSKLFFIANTDLNESAQNAAFETAAKAINHLWQVVEHRLTNQSFFGGDRLSAADIMLSVYSRWGDSFPVEIIIGPKTKAMIDHIIAMPSFQLALQNEALQTAA